jgi:hypothetical protein
MGTYRFQPKVVAFRNDFCLTCNTARRAVEIRTFNVLSFRGIPLIPVGYWKRWLCTECTVPPGYNRRSRRKFAVTLAALAAAFAVIFWSLPIEPDQVETWLFIRRISPVVMIGAIIWAVLAEGTPSTAERLTNILPAQETMCPFCQSPLLTYNWHCSSCGIQRK